MEFDFARFRPYGLVAFVFWFAGIVLPEAASVPSGFGSTLFVIGLIVFAFGWLRVRKA